MPWIFKHKDLAAGGWFKLSLAEQMGNIGSEVWRALRSEGKADSIRSPQDNERFWSAVERALELFDLTLEDPRWHGRRQEIARAREVFCDAVYGGKLYKSSLKSLTRYFDQFAFAAANKKF